MRFGRYAETRERPRSGRVCLRMSPRSSHSHVQRQLRKSQLIVVSFPHIQFHACVATSVLRCPYWHSSNILLNFYLRTRLCAPLRLAHSASSAYSSVARVKSSSCRIFNTHYAPAQALNRHVRRPWPLIATKMSDSEDDRPLKGTWIC